MTENNGTKYLFLIHCLDDLSCGMVENGARFGGSSKRMSLLKEHRAYQTETVSPTSPTYIRKISAGPLESDDGKFMVGSAFIVESTREEVDRFIAGDPFHQNGVWKQISINRYVSIPNGIRSVTAQMENHDLSTVTMVVNN